jgi:hypothetical protein
MQPTARTLQTFDLGQKPRSHHVSFMILPQTTGIITRFVPAGTPWLSHVRHIIISVSNIATQGRAATLVIRLALSKSAGSSSSTYTHSCRYTQSWQRTSLQAVHLATS